MGCSFSQGGAQRAVSGFEFWVSGWSRLKSLLHRCGTRVSRLPNLYPSILTPPPSLLKPRVPEHQLVAVDLVHLGVRHHDHIQPEHALASLVRVRRAHHQGPKVRGNDRGLARVAGFVEGHVNNSSVLFVELDVFDGLQVVRDA